MGDFLLHSPPSPLSPFDLDLSSTSPLLQLLDPPSLTRHALPRLPFLPNRLCVPACALGYHSVGLNCISSSD